MKNEQLELFNNTNISKALYEVIKIYESCKNDKSYSFYVDKDHKGQIWFKTRYYCTYDRPDWDNYIKLTPDEADRVVESGYAVWRQ